jgi:glycosyltransferase involved in cell wall biosynthesis
MKNNFFISVVIPTYNRSKYLLKILDILKSNSVNFNRFEVIICDSFSKDHTQTKINTFKSFYKNINIKYLNLNKNIHSIKRNTGILEAKGRYIVFLDDDCFPDKTFLKDYYKIFSNYKNKNNIYCGSVDYQKEIKKNNFLKYRKTRHFILNKNQKIFEKNLKPSKIVTMNMGFENSYKILKTKLFNKNFNSYGFEDYEFGYRLSKEGFNLKACSVLVVHNDLRRFYLYLNKIRFLGYQSMKYLVNINYDAAKNNNFFILENNFIIKFLLNLYFFEFLLNNLLKFSIFFEKKFFYFPLVYKTGIAVAYLLGCIDRQHYLKGNIRFKKWYI